MTVQTSCRCDPLVSRGKWRPDSHPGSVLPICFHNPAQCRAKTAIMWKTWKRPRAYQERNFLGVNELAERQTRVEGTEGYCPCGIESEMDLASLTRIKGIGRAKAAGLVAAFELSRRALNSGMGIEPAITRPGDIVSIIADIKAKRKEHFLAVFLNARNQVICREEVSVGSLNASLV